MNTFNVSSLFENKDYQTVFALGTGEALGRIYTEGNKYIAHFLSKDIRGECTRFEDAQEFCRTGEANLFNGVKLIEKKEPKPIRYDVYMCSQYQKKVLEKFDKRAPADHFANQKNVWAKRTGEDLTYQVIPVFA